MNTITKSSILPRMIVTAALGGLISSFSAICPAADGTAAPQATVKYGDLNLASAQAAAELYARISVTASGVCRNLEGRDLKSKTLFGRCVHKAIAGAVAKVDQPALYTVYNTKTSIPKPIMLASGEAH
jgi:UrcA family protein